MQKNEITSGLDKGVEGKNLCANCGGVVEAHFCPHCGEKVLTDKDYSILHLIREGTEQLFDFDFKFLNTIGRLLTNPGLLTSEYWAGRRIRYTKPLQLLLLINIFYFFCSYVSSLLGNNIRVMFPTLEDITYDRVFAHMASEAVKTKIALMHIPAAVYYESFNTHLEQLAKSLVILLVPLLALFLQVFYWRSKRFFVEHLISAAHLVSFYVLFWSLFMLLLGGLTATFSHLFQTGQSFQRVLFPILRYLPAPVIGVYIFFALKRVYEESLLVTFVKSALFIFFVIQAITNIYDFILFWVAYVLV